MSDQATDETTGTTETTDAGGAPDAASLPCGDQPLTGRVEALLVSTDRPLTDARLVDLLGLGGGRRKRSGDGPERRVRDAIEELNGAYDAGSRAFRIERLAGGWQLLTRAEYGPLLARLHRDRQQSRLSQAALETLAIIAYRQPLLRAEVEAIRGVACGEVLRGLLDRRLIKIVGRAEELGRPMLYGTTREFLTVFGLPGLDDLPEVEGLRRERRRRSAPEPESGDAAGTADEPEPKEAEAEAPATAE